MWEAAKIRRLEQTLDVLYEWAESRKEELRTIAVSFAHDNKGLAELALNARNEKAFGKWVESFIRERVGWEGL